MPSLSGHIVLLALSVLAVAACATQIKADRLRRQPVGASLALSEEPKMQDLRTDSESSDTLKVMGPDGREVILMRAVQDENGDMVASDILSASVVEAKFRNVAERHGKVELHFDIRVPSALRDSKWQVRFHPKMEISGQTTMLDRINITGRLYRRAQLKGYQQYEKFLSTIITDSTRFIREHDLEVFLKRNIPPLYELKRDSSYVSDEEFSTIYGVTQAEAVQHYKNHIRERANRWRIGRKDRMYGRYVKVPIINDGMRLDTVIVSEGGDFVYEYVQTVKAFPGLRRVDIALEGEIFEEDRRVYSMPSPEPLTFYISSLGSLVDDTPRYRTVIIERRVMMEKTSSLDFACGRSDLDLSLGDNASRMDSIIAIFRQFSDDEEFRMDSVVITASCSPEGRYEFNRTLSRSRGKSVGRLCGEYIAAPVRIVPKEQAENWNGLERLVSADPLLTDSDRQAFSKIMDIADPDKREYYLSKTAAYSHIRNDLYPRLRTVAFDFFLSRRSMQKDTVFTEILDTLYMSGIQAIKDREYEKAVDILYPYSDFNAAVALTALDRDHSALAVLEALPESGRRDYLAAILYSRTGDDISAVRNYLRSCSLDPSYVHRGNLDPEISSLIRKYNLNEELQP